MNNLIAVLCVEPNRHPYVACIDSNWDVVKHCLGDGLGYPYNGRICLGDDAVILYNELAPLSDLQGNRKVGDYIIAGIFYITGMDNGKLVSLSTQNLKKYALHFWNPERYTWAEIIDSYFDSFVAGIDSLEHL